MRVVVFTNGDYGDESFYKAVLSDADFVICTDGGGNYLYRWGIKPQLLMGDMDSISEEALKGFRDRGVHIKLFPRDKDYTDTHLAIMEAMRLSPSEVVIVGGLGTRLDHILANLHLLFFLFKRGIRAKILNEFYEVSLISEGVNRFEVWGNKISLLPLSEEVEFASSEGLKWPLFGLRLSLETPIGISNEPTSSNFVIEVKKGLAFVFQVREG